MSIRGDWKLIMKSIRPVVLAMVGAGVLTVGCATSTQITSNPPGAKAYLNDRLIGETPCVYVSRSGFPEACWVRLEKSGFKPQTAKMQREYRADESLLLLLPGIIPYFFSARYEDQENFVLDPGR